MLRVSLCQRNKSKNVLTWYARIFDTETKEIRYESLGTTKKTEAHDLMLAKQAAGEFAKDLKSNMTLGKAFGLYLDDCETRGCSADTMAFLGRSLRTLSPLFERPIASIKKSDVLETFNANAGHLKPSSYNSTKTVVKTAFKFSRDVLEVIQASPADCLKSRKFTTKERDIWTVEQMERILDRTCEPETRLVFAFMAYAGLRVHEAVKVKPCDIKDGFISVIGKGGKFAKIPVSSRMQKEIERAGENFDLSSIKMGCLYMKLRNITNEALGDTFEGKAHPHRFRHSFASALIKSGVNPKSLQKLLRHSNITTTLQIYSHVLEEDLAEDIEKMFTGH